MPRLVNRGFTITLLAVTLVAELALRAATSAPPAVIRVVYGTTLSMYMEVEHRLAAAAPDTRVLALGDSLALTQFQPDVFAADHGLPVNTVFNASYLALTFRSQENLLRSIGVDRFPQLRRVLMFVNPRRLTREGNVDAAVFRVVIPDADGPWSQMRADKSISPLLDYSRLYGLSRYLVTASWRQIGRPPSWDEVEYLMPQGGVAYDRPRAAGDRPVFPYELISDVSEIYVADLKRVINTFRDRGIDVVMLPNASHASVNPFATASVEAGFQTRMQMLAEETRSEWVTLPAGAFAPPVDTDFLDYGHLNRSGGVAFTHYLHGALAPLPPIH
jgi:hypothetical protein